MLLIILLFLASSVNANDPVESRMKKMLKGEIPSPSGTKYNNPKGDLYKWSADVEDLAKWRSYGDIGQNDPTWKEARNDVFDDGSHSYSKKHQPSDAYKDAQKAWDKHVTDPKSKGGMGFKDMEAYRNSPGFDKYTKGDFMNERVLDKVRKPQKTLTGNVMIGTMEDFELWEKNLLIAKRKKLEEDMKKQKLAKEKMEERRKKFDSDVEEFKNKAKKIPERAKTAAKRCKSAIGKGLEKMGSDTINGQHMGAGRRVLDEGESDACIRLGEESSECLEITRFRRFLQENPESRRRFLNNCEMDFNKQCKPSDMKCLKQKMVDNGRIKSVDDFDKLEPKQKTQLMREMLEKPPAVGCRMRRMLGLRMLQSCSIAEHRKNAKNIGKETHGGGGRGRPGPKANNAWKNKVKAANSFRRSSRYRPSRRVNVKRRYGKRRFWPRVRGRRELDDEDHEEWDSLVNNLLDVAERL